MVIVLLWVPESLLVSFVPEVGRWLAGARPRCPLPAPRRRGPRGSMPVAHIDDRPPGKSKGALIRVAAYASLAPGKDDASVTTRRSVRRVQAVAP